MKTALITGATSGIGEEFARVFADRGYRLILTGRRVERLEALAEELTVPVRIIQADLAQETGIRKLLAGIRKERIDVFINNAGFGACGRFIETDIEREVSMIKVNDIAMQILFKAVLRKMERSDHGIILNVASSAGLLPGGPYMATYYASKAYAVSLTRAVAQELKESGSAVYVAALCPGPVNTEFNDNADVIFAMKGISAQTCVAEAIKGLNRHQTIIAPTLPVKMGLFASKVLPMGFTMKLVGRQQKSKFYQ